MTYEQLLAAYRAQGGEVGTDAQNQAFNAWTMTLPGGADGNWANITSTTPLPSNPALQPSTPGNPTEIAPTNTNIGTGIGSLLSPGNAVAAGAPSGIAAALDRGVAMSAGAGNNTNQVQGGMQSGGYNSQGNQVQTNQQNTSQQGQTAQQTAGSMEQAVTGANQQQQSGTQQQQQSGTTQQQQTGTNQQQTTGTEVGQTQQDTSGRTTGQQQTTGTQQQQGTTGTTQQQTGATQQRTAETSNVIDTLGLSDLVRGQVAGTGQADAFRRAELQKIATQGGAGLQSQMDQAIRQAMSGPGMTGVGESTAARAGGYAAEQMGRQDLDARLNALSQLAGPTASGTLVGQSSNLLGRSNVGDTTGTSQNSTIGSEIQNLLSSNASTTNSLQDQVTKSLQQSQNQSNQNMTGSNASNTTGSNVSNMSGSNQSNTSGTNSQNTIGSNLASMVGSSNQTGSATGRATDSTNQAGTAVGSNLNVATGQTPQQSQSSGGGCFVASALASLHLIGPRGIRKAVRYKLDRCKYMPIGYALYGPWLAQQVLKHSWVRRLMLPVVRSILFEELRLAGKARCLVPHAWTAHLIFHYGSAALGFVASLFGAKFETKDVQLRTLLLQHNLYFN